MTHVRAFNITVVTPQLKILTVKALGINYKAKNVYSTSPDWSWIGCDGDCYESK